MECPISYHITCIPPSARFHELAILCHEHAGTCKLPQLDHDASLQGLIEKKIDDKFDTFAKKRQRKALKNRAMEKNLFFPGISGQLYSATEYKLLEKLHEKFDDYTDEDLFFCLPCDLKEEVYLKPPSYKHIQSNQYDPTNRPTKVLTSGQETCTCEGFCGDDCLNRSLYVECYGEGMDSKKPSNCSVGPNCGNRLFSQRKFIQCTPKREEGKGWGLTVCENVKRGDLIIEYVGEIIDAETKEKRLIEWTMQHPNDPNFYIMALQPGWFIDAREKANLSRFINHSCEPNCVILPVNAMGRIRCGIIASRDIGAGEFLSYDYHFDTRDGDKFICRCGSLKCRGTMQSGNKISSSASSNKKSKGEILDEAKATFERDKKFLNDYYEDSIRRSCLVRETVPGAEAENNNSKEELVANGPQLKYRTKVQGNHLFLWRNAELGSDFAYRFARLRRREVSKL